MTAEVRMFPVDAKILMIDDSNFSRQMIKSALKELKYLRLLEASDAATAQSCLLEDEQQKDPVHLIICDQQMPEMTGLEFLKWIRNHERFKHMPVIMLTTNQEKPIIVEAGRIGVSHYMLKPFDVNTLRDRLAATWKKHGEFYYHANKKSP